MNKTIKALYIAAHVGICSWILFLAFNTTKMPIEKLTVNYIACAVGVFALSKIKTGPKKNV